MDHEEIPEERIIIYDMHYSSKDFINFNKTAKNRENIVYQVVDKCTSLYQKFYPGIRYLALLAARWSRLLIGMDGRLVISINEDPPMGYIDIYFNQCTIGSTDLKYFGTVAKESGSYVSISKANDEIFGSEESCLRFLISVPLKNQPNI